MATVAQMFNTTFNPAELNKRSFSGAMITLYPSGSTPLFYLADQLGATKAQSNTHGYFTRTWEFPATTSDGGNLDSDTTITIAATNGLIEGMTLLNRATREVMRITAVNSTTSLDVTRGFGRIAAAAITNGDALVVIGNASPEGSARPTPRSLSFTHVTNYTHILRDAWALTDSARASMVEQGMTNIASKREDCGINHAIAIEQTILYSQAQMDTSGTQPMHTTQGVDDAIREYASGNVNSAAATTNFDELVDLVLPAFQYSTDQTDPTTRIGICDSQAMQVIQSVARLSGQIQMTTAQTTFGMRYTDFQFYKGSIKLLESPIMNAHGSQGTMYVLDMPAIKLAYLGDRRQKPEGFGLGGSAESSDGVDANGGSLTSEFAVECINPNACAIVEGLTEGAA